MKFLISNIRLLAPKFKSVAVINVVGLSVAFAVTLVVAKQLWYDATYDRRYENSGSIHLAELDRVVERINDPVLLAEADGGMYSEYRFYLTQLSRFHLYGGRCRLAAVS